VGKVDLTIELDVTAGARVNRSTLSVLALLLLVSSIFVDLMTTRELFVDLFAGGDSAV